MTEFGKFVRKIRQIRQICQLSLNLGKSQLKISLAVLYNPVIYFNMPLVKFQVIDTRTVHISGDWDLGGRDNEGTLFGYMNCQRYVKQPNGKWLLELDDWTVEPTDFLY